MKKLKSTITETDLLRARKEGLERARSLDAMQAHGKWKGMDVFSWANPHFDALASVLSSFPFPVVWVGKQEQIKCACKYYPEVMDTIETAIVFDQANVKLNPVAIDNLEKVAGVGDVQSAIQLVSGMDDARRVFLFTTEGDNALRDMNEFNSFRENW
jgi:hypothetical protein